MNYADTIEIGVKGKSKLNNEKYLLIKLNLFIEQKELFYLMEILFFIVDKIENK